MKPAYLTDRNQRQRVPYNGPEAPGTIVVDPYARVLYDVLEGGEAMRFGIAVGRAGTGFAGSGTIRRKAAWPSWTPTANMVRTEPELYGAVRNGLPGGPQGAHLLPAVHRSVTGHLQQRLHRQRRAQEGLRRPDAADLALTGQQAHQRAHGAADGAEHQVLPGQRMAEPESKVVQDVHGVRTAAG